MNPYYNEDAAWQRIQDIQREFENSRLWAEGRRPDWYMAVGRLLRAGVRRLVRREAAPAEPQLTARDAECASDAA